jgi:glucan phosphoethanolaminetransferase (alkaline phosphatase superfamily)
MEYSLIQGEEWSSCWNKFKYAKYAWSYIWLVVALIIVVILGHLRAKSTSDVTKVYVAALIILFVYCLIMGPVTRVSYDIDSLKKELQNKVLLAVPTQAGGAQAGPQQPTAQQQRQMQMQQMAQQMPY